MKKIYLATRRFLREEEGVTAIEYGLVASLIALALITGASALGGSLNNLFNAIGACIAGTGTCPITAF